MNRSPHVDVLFPSFLGLYFDESKWTEKTTMSCFFSALSKVFNASLYVFCGFQNHYNDYNMLFHKPFKSHSTFVTIVARVDSKIISTAAYVVDGSIEYLKIARLLYLWIFQSITPFGERELSKIVSRNAMFSVSA